MPLDQVYYQEIEQLNLTVVVNFATGLRRILKAPHKVTFLKSFLENQQTETNYKLLTVTAYNLVKNMWLAFSLFTFDKYFKSSQYFEFKTQTDMNFLLLWFLDICSDPSKRQSSFKRQLLIGWKWVSKCAGKATTCWIYWSTERTWTTFIWITISIWSQSKLLPQRKERSPDLEMLSIFVGRFCDSQSSL